MSEEKKNLFTDMDEPVQVKRLREAGIHRKVRYDGVEYHPPETRTEGGKTTELSARATIKFTVLKDVFDDKDKTKVTGTDELVFEEMRFCPPTSEEEVKFTGDKYVNGKKVGKKSNKEQMIEDWEGFGMQLAQLGAALGVQFSVVKAKLAKYFKDYSVDTFKGLIEGFEKEFPQDKYKDKFIDIKAIWVNNTEKRTSFLRLSKATGKNLAFAPYRPGEKQSSLFLSDYELKNNMKAKYNGTAAPPSGSEEIVDEGGTGGSGEKEVGLSQGSTASGEDDLF
jgi:hypothetical protein